MPGSRRSFPATTTITVANRGCGQRLTWRPNKQHKETQELCPQGNRVRLASYSSRLGFFGVSSSEHFRCGRDADVYAADAPSGATWAFSCTSSDSTAHQQVTVIGRQTLHVGSTAVRTLHVHVATTLTGADSGTSYQDVWIGTRTALLVRNVGRVDATNGGVQYHETYSLMLDSTTPQR